MNNPYFRGHDYDDRYSFMALRPGGPMGGMQHAPGHFGHPGFAGSDGMVPGCPQALSTNQLPGPGCADSGALACAQAMQHIAQLGPWNQARLFPGLDPAFVRESARGKDLLYGFDSGTTLIAAGTTVTLSVAPQKRHIPVRLVVDDSTASNFVLSSIAIGVEPVLATVGNLSMAIFRANSTAPDFRSVVAEVGNDISLTVTNITAGPLRFVATMVGTELPSRQ